VASIEASQPDLSEAVWEPDADEVNAIAAYFDDANAVEMADPAVEGTSEVCNGSFQMDVNLYISYNVIHMFMCMDIQHEYIEVNAHAVEMADPEVEAPEATSEVYIVYIYIYYVYIYGYMYTCV
jgi:hypothetical protein